MTASYDKQNAMLMPLIPFANGIEIQKKNWYCYNETLTYTFVLDSSVMKSALVKIHRAMATRNRL